MAVTRISELTPMTNPVPSDLFIINDGDVTRSINYGSFSDSIILDTQAADLVFTGSVGLSGAVTFDGVVTVNADITFLGEFGGVGINQLNDVQVISIPTDGYVLAWNSSLGNWAPKPEGVEPNTVVDSFNGQVGDVTLDADGVDDTTTDHKFVTSVQLGLINNSIQPLDNISELTNDANYLASGDNVSELTNDAGYLTTFTAPVESVNGLSGVVVLDPDDLDDTSTDHKFATSVQLGLAETAVQPTDSIDALSDVDTSLIGGPEVGSILRWDGSNWIPSTGVTTEWEVTNDSTTSYGFDGIGFDGTEANPDIYLVRGQTYRFKRGNGHPFAIQTTAGTSGTLYNDGITNNEVENDTLVWEVQMDAPDDLFYQCRSHAAMVGNIYVLNTAAAVSGSSDASNFTWDASLIPDTNETYDLGSAEYKVRHLFLSDNSIKFESGDLNVVAGNLAWQGESILPTTVANLLSVLGVASHLDNAEALGGGLIPGDIYYNTTESKLKAVTA